MWFYCSTHSGTLGILLCVLYIVGLVINDVIRTTMHIVGGCVGLWDDYAVP